MKCKLNSCLLQAAKPITSLFSLYSSLNNISTLVILMAVWSFFFSSCKHSSYRENIDKMNEEAYSQRYKDLDSLNIYSTNAYDEALKFNYKYGMADALCNRAFYSIARMHYAQADSLLRQVHDLASDNISRLETEVLYMRLCQRRSLNKEFYLHQFRAEKLITHIHNNLSALNEKQKNKYTYLRCEYGIILSAYLYYVGHSDESLTVLHKIADDKDIILHNDTAQWLNYLYNMGDGGVTDQPTEEATLTKEFDYLMQCYMVALHTGYTYWEANSLQAISEQLMDPNNLSVLEIADDASLRYLNNDNVPDSLLALTLSQRALELFVRYGDAYQTAAAWRTLAENYMQMGDFQAMLSCLKSALQDTLLKQSPNILASLDEKLCIAYSALNDKPLSDNYRNQYLDLQDSTRQDRQLEARADEMHFTLIQLQVEVVIVFVLFLVMLIVLYLLLKRRKSEKYKLHYAKLEDLIEELQDEIAMCQLNISDSKRLNLEQHAKLSLVQNILPMIDRMVYSATHKQTDESREYISELCNDIQCSNELLTKWVQLRKGDIKLKVESFPLQELFDVVKLGQVSFHNAGITLLVPDTDIVLKADKALTLFLINTLLDNARKFEPVGGTIQLTATKSDDGFADISVIDTGKGMPQEQAQHLFEYQTIETQESKIDNSEENLKVQKSHGFGLVNCRGIINRYKKTSSLFAQADIKAISEVGKGTTITFRLPFVVKMLIAVFTLCFASVLTVPSVAQSQKQAQSTSYKSNPYYQKASLNCDTVYQCNVNGQYDLTLCYADSCLKYLNLYYKSLYPNATDTLVAMNGDAEMGWYERKVPMDYNLILSLRNEVAVASLALHEWNIYKANNSIYTSLYRECSADATLDTYCHDMAKYETISNLVISLLVLLIICIFWIIYVFYFRDIKRRKVDLGSQIEELEQQAQQLRSERDRLYVQNSIIDNTLSTIKHETMYYPARISNLIENGSEEDIKELVIFYRSLYGILSSQCMKLASDKAYPPHTFTIAELAESASKTTDMSELESINEQKLLGNKELISYLLLMLKRKNKAQISVKSHEIADDWRYIRLSVLCENIHFIGNLASEIFMSSTSDVDYLVMKQIMREIGAMANRYGSGISVTSTSEGSVFAITLPLKGE